MAKKKISGLPASVALTGTEIVPIVQSGTTKRTTTQDIADLGSGGGGISGSGTANFVSKWSDGTTLTDSLFFSDGNIAKTIKNDGYTSGLYLNLNNNNVYFALGFTETGDWENEAVVGFKATYNVFTMGDTGFNNGTHLFIDDQNQIIKTLSGGADKGLYLDFANAIYGLGFTETGDWVGENATGVKLTSNNITIGDTWGYSSYIDINFSQLRTYLETSRVKYRNLTTTQINALTATALEGDVVYNSTLHVLCFYDGSGWKKVSHSAM